MTAIDASSLAKFALKEEGWEEVGIQLRRGCVSLELAVNETGNAFWKAVRAKRLDPPSATARFTEFTNFLPFQTVDQALFYQPAFELALKEGIPFYDGLYVALAAEGGHDLVTSDRSQARIAERIGIKVRFID